MLFLVLSIPITTAEALNLVTDANGNLVSGDGLYREYNSLNQLWKVYNDSASGFLMQEYYHHPIEERVLVKITYNEDGTNETVYYFTKSHVRVVNSSGTYDTKYLYHNGQLVSQETEGVKHFIHSDHLGSSTVVSDENGNIVENTSYSPFGSVVEGSLETRFDYEAKEFDSVVGDTDFHFRKYKSDWGLFLQPDTVIPNVYDPQSLNRYMFERGNPYGNVDVDGHNPVVFVYLGYIAVAAATTYTAAMLGTGLGILADSIPPDAKDKMGDVAKKLIKFKSISNSINSAYDPAVKIYDAQNTGTTSNRNLAIGATAGYVIDLSFGLTLGDGYGAMSGTEGTPGAFVSQIISNYLNNQALENSNTQLEVSDSSSNPTLDDGVVQTKTVTRDEDGNVISSRVESNYCEINWCL